MAEGNFQDLYIKKSGQPIHLVRCTDLQGRKCYFFLMCSMEKVKQLQSPENKQKDSLDLRDYGNIVASGFGVDPSDEVIKMLKDKYDFVYKPQENKDEEDESASEGGEPKKRSFVDMVGGPKSSN